MENQHAQTSAVFSRPESRSGLVERTLATLELLATQPNGICLGDMAVRLGIPRSAMHRLLADLVMSGYARQADFHGPYFLTERLSSLVHKEG